MIVNGPTAARGSDDLKAPSGIVGETKFMRVARRDRRLRRVHEVVHLADHRLHERRPAFGAEISVPLEAKFSGRIHVGDDRVLEPPVGEAAADVVVDHVQVIERVVIEEDHVVADDELALGSQLHRLKRLILGGTGRRVGDNLLETVPTDFQSHVAIPESAIEFRGSQSVGQDKVLLGRDHVVTVHQRPETRAGLVIEDERAQRLVRVVPAGAGQFEPVVTVGA